MTIINAKHFSAYILCPYKAYLLLHTKEIGETNDYENLILKYTYNSQTNFLKRLPIEIYSNDSLKKGYKYLQDVKIYTDGFEFDCSLLIKKDGKSLLGKFYYEPAIFIGLNQITKEHRLALAFFKSIT